MIESPLVLCADSVVIDQLSNNVSVFNIIQEIAPESLPLILARFTVLTVLERDPDEDPSSTTFDLRITLNGTTLVDGQQIEVNFQGKRRSRSVVQLGLVPITQPGTMTVSCCIEDRELGHWLIEVVPPRQQPVVRTLTPIHETASNP